MIEELDDVDNEMTNSSLRISGPVRISVASTFGSFARPAAHP